VASFFVLTAIIVGLFLGFLGLRRLGAARRTSAIEAGVVIATGKHSQVQLAQQTLRVAGIFSTTRDVDSTVYLPHDIELWVKEKDAELARDVLGLDADL